MKGYAVIVIDDIDIPSVQSTWLALQKEVNNKNVFLDWFWIGNWLRQVCHLRPKLLKFVLNEKTVGLAFFCKSTKRVAGFPITQNYLNRTGIKEYDQPWIEFNDLLVSSEHRTACFKVFHQWAEGGAIDEWIISLVVADSLWLDKSNDAHNMALEVEKTPAYSTDLSIDINDLNGYLSTLSSNSRSTVRRAIRYIEAQYGDISFEVHTNYLAEKNFEEIMLLHKQRWPEGEQQSGFFNPLFIDFHRYLQTNPSQHFQVETLIFKTENITLGYLYNLVGHGDVKFYLSAINYCNQTNRFQPGLVMHAYAIVHYAKLGLKNYDFMGGDNRYKRSLSNNCYSLFTATLRPKTLKNSLITGLKSIKRILPVTSA